MTHIHDLFRARLLERAGLSEPRLVLKLSDLEKSEWSSEFEQLMRNRLIVGALRYGLLGSPEKRIRDNVKSIKARIEFYVETGNCEHLVDVANLCLIEFVAGSHPNKHFKSVDDGPHVAVKMESEIKI